MKDFICPFCLKKHNLSTCLYRCDAANCPYGAKRDEFGYVKYDSIKKICDKKCSETYKIICPDESTHGSQVIPQRALNQSVSIALLGGRNSGKSNYIAVLVNEIKRKMSGAFNCSLMPCDDSTDTRYQTLFYAPIFKDSMPLASTSAERQQPLLFTLDFYHGRRATTIDNLLLPLYDTAGENMESLEKLGTNVNYIKSAGGIILLLDPFEIEEIASQIQANVGGQQSVSKMEDILNRVQNILQQKNTKKVIETPIAIVLTKLDLVNDFTSLIPEDSILRQPSAHIGMERFSMREFKAVDSAVRSLIMSSNETASNLFRKLQGFRNAAFFAVSSFGCDPSVADLKKQMKPQRVLDPLLWLLALNGYIRTGK